MVSSSAGEGPGSPISRGLIERRILRKSMASGNAGSFIGNDGASHSTRCRRPRAVDGHFRPIVIGCPGDAGTPTIRPMQPLGLILLQRPLRRPIQQILAEIFQTFPRDQERAVALSL